MNRHAILAVATATLSCFVPSSRAQYCDFPPKQLTQGEHREYRGPYANNAYGYSVVIPANLVGYDDVNPFYQHGFGIVVGAEQQSYILVNGEPNSLEFADPAEAASQLLKYLPKHGNKVESSKISEAQIGHLKASLLIATYTCPGSTEGYVASSMVALSPDKSTLYEVTLYAHAGRFDQDKAVLDAIVKSWKHLPRHHESPSAFDKCRIVTPADLADKKAPTFASYRVAVSHLSNSPKLDLRSNPTARMYRTLLRQEVSRGPNFAGHYRVAVWGCGSSCAMFAVVNLNSGRVITPEGFSATSYVYFADQNFFPKSQSGYGQFGFRGDSRLLLVLGDLDEDESREGAFYFVLEGERLRPIYSTVVNKDCEDLRH